MDITGKKILAGLLGAFVVYNGAKWAWGEAAEAYFKYRCEQDAGEFIYRTVENVEGVFQMRPREKGEYFSRLRRGDLMKDPYGHTNREAERPWRLFLPKLKETGYLFFESRQGPDISKYMLHKRIMTISEIPVYTGESFWRYTYHGLRRVHERDEFWTMHEAKQISNLKSKYGYTWRQIQTGMDAFFGVIGGELVVKELSKNEPLAIRRGFIFWPSWSSKSSICPKIKHDNITYEFVSKVLKPVETSGIVLEEKDYGY